jgi:hypothetical protein
MFVQRGTNIMFFSHVCTTWYKHHVFFSCLYTVVQTSCFFLMFVQHGTNIRMSGNPTNLVFLTATFGNSTHTLLTHFKCKTPKMSGNPTNLVFLTVTFGNSTHALLTYSKCKRLGMSGNPTFLVFLSMTCRLVKINNHINSVIYK